uniref:Uncharacterized protein n=1 Tax=Hyaloperonospora arabidopsidis (strain Emoy2) TaxID=559515 RepID=M4BAD0_HYAAE
MIVGSVSAMEGRGVWMLFKGNGSCAARKVRTRGKSQRCASATKTRPRKRSPRLADPGNIRRH